ncbi:hypothetical protein Vadar_025028 [Vaccinium darrowii]|uniref:Uncharacterized protein n=1 Tax=Vaccinium darrowii TaxID=229202 RepID=A0ACB7YI05_9ERIC|nr:hypothetical protein Vadar_025028 [Vaccinium darrowii]
MPPPVELCSTTNLKLETLSHQNSDDFKAPFRKRGKPDSEISSDVGSKTAVGKGVNLCISEQDLRQLLGRSCQDAADILGGNMFLAIYLLFSIILKLCHQMLDHCVVEAYKNTDFLRFFAHAVSVSMLTRILRHHGIKWWPNRMGGTICKPPDPDERNTCPIFKASTHEHEMVGYLDKPNQVPPDLCSTTNLETLSHQNSDDFVAPFRKCEKPDSDISSDVRSNKRFKGLANFPTVEEKNRSPEIEKGICNRNPSSTLESSNQDGFKELGMDPANRGIYYDLLKFVGMKEVYKSKDKLMSSRLLEYVDDLLLSCGDERIIVFTTNNRDLHAAALRRHFNKDIYIHKSSPPPVASPDEGEIVHEGEIVQLDSFEQNETEAAESSFKWAFQQEGLTTQYTAYPNPNTLVFAQPEIASTEVLSENMRSSEDTRNLLPSQEVFLEGHVSKSNNLTFPACSDAAAPSQLVATILPKLPLVCAQPEIASTEMLSENMGSSQDTRNLLASQEEVFLDGHIPESSNLTFPACSDAAAPSQLVATILHTSRAIPHIIPHLTGGSSETFQLGGQSMQSTSYPYHNSLVFQQPQITLTQIRSENMWSSEDWGASQQEPFLEGHVYGSINSAHQSDPIVLTSEKKDMGEGLRRECLTKCVLSLDDSTKQTLLLDFDAAENKAHLLRAYKSGPAVSVSDNKNREDALKGEFLEDLQEICGGRRDAAAKRFGAIYDPGFHTTDYLAQKSLKVRETVWHIDREREIRTQMCRELSDSASSSRWPIGLPNGSHIVLLDPFEQSTQNIVHVAGVEECYPTVCLPEKKMVRTLKRKYRTISVIVENHQQHQSIALPDGGEIVQLGSSVKKPLADFDATANGGFESCVLVSHSKRRCMTLSSVSEFYRIDSLAWKSFEFASSSRWPIGLPDGGNVLLLDPLEQSTKNVAHAAKADLCSPTVRLPKKKMVRKSLKTKCRTMSLVFEDRRKHFDRRCEGAAKSLSATRICMKHGINRVSSVNRIHKPHGIHWWPFRQKWARRKVYSLGGERTFEVSSVSMDDILDSRLLFFHMPQFARSSLQTSALPDRGEIVGPVALSSSEIAATNNRAHYVRQDQNGYTTSHYEWKSTRVTADRQGIAMSLCSVKDLHQHFGCKHKDVVKRLGEARIIEFFSSSERKAFDATNNRAHLIEDDQSGPTVSNLEKETMREASKRKCIAKGVLISEDLGQHYGGGQRDAAKSLCDSLVRNSLEVLDVLPLWEESNTIEHLVPWRRLALQQRWIRPKKSLDLPRTLQMNCTGGLTVQSASSLDWPICLPVGGHVVSLSKKIIVRKTFKRECRTVSVSFEGHQQHFGSRCEDVANSAFVNHICEQHGISLVPTVKRIHRQHEIHRLPCRQGNSSGRERPVEVISVSTEEKLISRLQFVRMSLLGRSSLCPLALPSGSEFPRHIAFSSSELTSTNNRAYPGRQDQCGSSASHIEKERTRETLYGEGTASHVFSFEHVQQHFGSKRKNDAKILGVCLSTFKRIMRHHRIRRWPNQARNNVWRSPDPHREKNLSPTFKMLSTNCSITMENDMGCKNLEPNELLPDSFEDLNFRNGENGSLAEIEKTPTFHDSFSGNCCEADICISEYDKTQAAGGSFKWAFQQKGLTTQFTANPNLNTLVFPHPQIASTEVLSKNMGSSEDGTKLLASQAEGFLEGDVSECSNLTFPLEGQSMQATACPNHNTLQLPQPLIALTQILNENMGSSEDWIASQQEPFLEGHVSGSINLTVPTCSGPSPSQQPMPTTPYTMHRVLHMLPPLTSSLDASSVKMKATYRDTIIEFQLPLASGSIELKEEVAKILKLEIDSFNVRYKDEEGEGDWILIPCDKDLRNYLQLFSSLVNPVIRLLVVDKDANLTNLDPMALKQPATFVESGIDPGSNSIVSDLLRFVSEKEICKKAGKAWTRSMSSIPELKNMLLSTPNRSLIAIQDIDHCAITLPNLKNELTVSCLLKYVDGLFSRCGDERIIVFTTNHRDRNDAALLPLVNMDIYIPASSPQPIALPDGGEIVQLESSEQKPLVDFDATNNRECHSGILVSSSKNNNKREASKRLCMTESILSVVDPTTGMSLTEFDAPNNGAHLVRARQGGPIMSNSEKKDTGEVLKRDFLTKRVLSSDDSTKQKSLPDCDATENEAHLLLAYQSCPDSLLENSLENRNRGEALKRECITKSILGLEDLQQHSGGRRDNAAKSFAAIYDPGIHTTNSLARKSFEVVETLRSSEQPIEPGPTKSPRYSAGSFAKSGTPLHWSDVLPDGGQVISLSWKEIVRKTLKRKCRTTKVRRLEYHQLHFESRCQDAAKRHGAKRICSQHVINQVSTVKCIHRQHAIHWWPFRQKWAMMKVYSLEGQRPLEVISPSTGWKLVSRLQVIHVSWLGRSSPGSSAIPGGGEIVGFIALSSSGFAATNNRANLLGQNPSGSTASHSNKKRRRDAAVDKGTNLYISEQDLRQHFGLTREEAARRLGVSVTTFKRHCRKHGILRWPCYRNRSSDIPGRPPDPDVVPPDFFDDLGACLGTPISSFLEEIAASGSYEAAFLPQEQITVSFAYPTHNHPVSAQPHIASKEMASENTRSSDLTTQVEAHSEGHGSGSNYSSVPTFSNPALSQPVSTISETGPTVPQHISTIPGIGPSQLEARLEVRGSGSSYLTVPTSSNPASTQPMSTIPETGPAIPQPVSTIPVTGPTIPHIMPPLIAQQDMRLVTIKAKYSDSIVRFKLPLTSGLTELNENVAKRLNLRLDSFDVEYRDEEGLWILISCDEDLRDYLQLFSSLDTPVIKLSVLDKVVNANESSGSFKRKRPWDA